MLNPVLDFLASKRVILLHSLLHLDFHVEDVLIVRRAELFLNCLYLGEEDTILVQRVHLKVVMNILWPLLGQISSRA